MKKTIFLLLFSLSVLTSYGQWKNAYASSLKIINSDSTHGELNNTEYVNAAGKYRYKENGVWKYRASTSDLSGLWPLNTSATQTGFTSITTSGGQVMTFGDSEFTGGWSLSNPSASDFLVIKNNAFSVSGTDFSFAPGNGTFNFLANSSTGGFADQSVVNFNIGGNGDPLNFSDGDFWYNPVTDLFKGRAAGTTVSFGSGGGITNGAADGQFMLSDGTNASGLGVLYQSSSGSGATIGIGTSSPATKLDVNITSSFANAVGTGARFGIESTTTPSSGIGVKTQFEVETSVDNHEITAEIESVTTQVTADIEHADLVFRNISQGSLLEALRMVSTNGTSRFTTAYANGFEFLGTFQVSGSTRINGTMKVGIFGDGTIDRRLHVEENSTGTNSVMYPLRLTRVVNDGNGAAGIGAGIEFESENGSGANVVGSTIESVATDVTSGSEDFDFVFKNMAAGAAAAEKFRVTSVGNATLVGTGTGVDWVATSDRRLKYHFKPASSQLDKISRMADIVTNYDRKDSGKNETGFIAQELLKVAQEYVVTPVDTASGYYSVNYAKMTPILVKGVDELSEEVSQLKKEVAELKAVIKQYITLEASRK